MFYHTTVKVEVLSEQALPAFFDLGALARAIDTGDCVGRVTLDNEKEVTGEQMAALLYEFGSEPGFFSLDNEGKEVR